MREAGVTEEEIPYTEIIYNTGDGYGGKLITYNSQNNQFYYHPYMWHIDDSQEFEEPVPCSPEQAVSIIANCNHDSKSKIPSINRIAVIRGIDVSVITPKEQTSEPPQGDAVLCTEEKKVVPRYAAEPVKGDGNILKSVR